MQTYHRHEQRLQVATYNASAMFNEIDNATLRRLIRTLINDIEANKIAYRCRVRNPEKVQVVKIRSILTSNEVFFTTQRRQPSMIGLRFYRYVDRYGTTDVVRQVVRQISFDLNNTSFETIEQFLKTEVLDWLYPNGNNLKAPLTRFMLQRDAQAAHSMHMGMGFQIASAGISSESGKSVMNITNSKGTVKRSLPLEELSGANNLRTIVGRYYVEFHNKKWLVLSEAIFNQQFAFVGEHPPSALMQ